MVAALALWTTLPSAMVQISTGQKGRFVTYNMPRPRRMQTESFILKLILACHNMTTGKKAKK